MATRKIQVTIQVRQDTAANWKSKNSVLASGEFGFDTTNKVLKIGDGATAWANLAAIEFDSGAPIAVYSYAAEEAEKAAGYTRGGELDKTIKDILARLTALEGGN